MKFKLTARWYYSGKGLDPQPYGPAGPLKTIEIDTKQNRKYDGATTAEDVILAYKEGITPDPVGRLVLVVEECIQIN